MTRLQQPLPYRTAQVTAQHESFREVCVPLYLPAFQPEMLGEGPAHEADDAKAEADFGASAGGWSVYDDEDDSEI